MNLTSRTHDYLDTIFVTAILVAWFVVTAMMIIGVIYAVLTLGLGWGMLIGVFALLVWVLVSAGVFELALKP